MMETSDIDAAFTNLRYAVMSYWKRYARNYLILLKCMVVYRTSLYPQ